jgi:hypothetical protein
MSRRRAKKQEKAGIIYACQMMNLLTWGVPGRAFRLRWNEAAQDYDVRFRL